MEHFLMGYQLVMVVVASEAAENAVKNINNLLFSILRLVGIGILGFSVFQLAIAMKGHDASNKAMAYLGIGAGILIIFIKEIVQMIVPGVLE